MTVVEARLGPLFRACGSFMRAPTSRDEGVCRPLERHAPFRHVGSRLPLRSALIDGKNLQRRTSPIRAPLGGQTDDRRGLCGERLALLNQARNRLRHSSVLRSPPSGRRRGLWLGSAASGRDPWLIKPLSLMRSEEHTSELQSQSNLVCRLLPEKKETHAHLGASWHADHDVYAFAAYLTVNMPNQLIFLLFSSYVTIHLGLAIQCSYICVPNHTS